MIKTRYAGLETALEVALFKIRRDHWVFGTRFPTVGRGETAEAVATNQADGYRLEANDHWLAGFWTGLLWLAYAASGDGDLRVHAESLLPSFQARLQNRVHITHDLGFLFGLSARAQWQLTGQKGARQLALWAADELVKRYRPAGRYVQAWGEVGDPAEGGRAIVDTLMNLPLLFWASAQAGNPAYRQAARAHAETSRCYLLRPDGATYHTFFFDQGSGAPLGPRTHQGYADDSLWARGQAWAIYGFALAAEWCASPSSDGAPSSAGAPSDEAGAAFLGAARQAARCFLAELPPDGLPTWDLRLPAAAPHYPDSSAGAIAAGGLLRLARLEGSGVGGEFGRAGIALLRSLVECCFEPAPESGGLPSSSSGGLLRHGTYHAHKKLGVDTFFICGDYFFLEALLAAQGRAADFWGMGDLS